jgi:hypothetical protein
MTTGRAVALPEGAEAMLSLHDFHLFVVTPPTTWPPPPDLQVYGGPMPDGKPHVWIRTTLEAAMNHRPGRWHLADGYRPPSSADGSPAAGELPTGTHVIGRIGTSSQLHALSPLGVEPQDDDIVYVTTADRRARPMPYAIARKFGRWTPVDAAAQRQTAKREPQAIPPRLRPR